MAFESSPQEIIFRFTQWELAASSSPRPEVAQHAPLAAPTLEEATGLLARLSEIRAEQAKNKLDWHARGDLGEPAQAAIGQLWEEWRNLKLGEDNGYRDVYGHIDPFYESPEKLTET